ESVMPYSRATAETSTERSSSIRLISPSTLSTSRVACASQRARPAASTSCSSSSLNTRRSSNWRSRHKMLETSLRSISAHLGPELGAGTDPTSSAGGPEFMKHPEPERAADHVLSALGGSAARPLGPGSGGARYERRLSSP